MRDAVLRSDSEPPAAEARAGTALPPAMAAVGAAGAAQRRVVRIQPAPLTLIPTF